MPADRIPWDLIKARWGSEVDEPHLAILPKGFAALVLAIAERFQWEATYRINDYDFSDWDGLQAIVDAGLGGLTDTMRLSEFAALVDEVEPLLEALLAKETCCGATTDGLEEIFTGSDELVGDEVNNTGSDVIRDVGDPPVSSTWAAYDSKLCDAAAKYAEGLITVINWAEVLADAANNLALAVATATLVATMGAIGLAATTIGVVLTGLNILEWFADLKDKLSSEDGWDTMRSDLAAHEQDIICAIITAETALEASQNLQTTITGINSAAWDFIRLLTFPGNAMERIFNEMSNAAAGFGGGCGSCEATEDVYTYVWAADLEGWTARTVANWNTTSGTNILSAGGNPAKSLGVSATVGALSPVLFVPAHNRVSVLMDHKRSDSSGGGVSGTVRVVADTALNTTLAGANPVYGATWQTNTYTLNPGSQPEGYYRVSFHGSSPSMNVDNVTITFYTV